MRQTMMRKRPKLDLPPQAKIAKHQFPKLTELHPLSRQALAQQCRVLAQVNIRAMKSLSILRVTSSSIATRISTTLRKLSEH